MTKDFSKHHEIINNFRGELSKPSFEKKYDAATKHLNKTEKFLLKMELKRLAAPCTRAIDLRGLVKGECQLFDFQGQSHFIDEVAIAAFNENAAIYGGYTFGVYEAVKNAKNSFRNIYENEQISPSAVENTINNKNTGVDKLQYPAKLHLITNYANRAEERMNFAIPISLKLANNKELQTTSIDLSVKGIKFKLINEVSLFEGDVITITFTGLEQEFQFNKDSLFYFEVKNVFRDSGTQLIGCQRVDIPEQDSFERFLTGYIQGNKRRYKINLDNSLAALQARSLEQYALVKINELPIFMLNAIDDANIVPRYALTTPNNFKLYQYWQDEKNKSAIQSLINAERFQRLLEKKQQGRDLLVFSFIHEHKGAKFFYTVDEDQLKDDYAFFKQFLAFSSGKSSFAVTALNVKKLKPDQAHSPFTLSTAMSKQQGHLNPPLTDEVKGIVAKLSYVVTATDITDDCAVSEYQNLDSKGIDLERLKTFGLRAANDNRVDEITSGYGQQRQEVRFKYQTPVVIECESLNWSGESADFSVSGMKIILESPAVLAKGDIVYLSFPKLQKITNAFDLKGLPYKIMRVNKNKTEVNLRVSVKEHQHIGRSFFKLLIDKNKNKLTPDEYAMLTPGLSAALRTLYGVNMAIPTAVVQASGSRYKVETLVSGQQGFKNHNNLLSDMLGLSDRHGYYNLYPLLGNLQFRNQLDHHMKKLLASDVAITERLFISIKNHKRDVESSVSIKLMAELETDELRREFIKRAMEHGKFYCMHLKLSRTDEAHMAYLNPELAYIGTYAIHRGKQLEQEIYSVAGLVQLFDVSQEVLLRHSFSS